MADHQPSSLKERQARANRHLYTTVALILLVIIVNAVLFSFSDDWNLWQRLLAGMPAALVAAWIGERERRWQKKNKQQ